MTLAVRLSETARNQLRELLEWWRTNRPKAPGHLAREIKRALRLLAEAPRIGGPHPHATVLGVRRYRLRRTPYHLFYAVDDATRTLNVLAVWSGARGMGPTL